MLKGRSREREDYLCALQCQYPEALGEEDAPAKKHARPAEGRIKDRETHVPGAEVRPLLPERDLRDMHLPVLAYYAVRPGDYRGVEISATVLLEHAPYEDGPEPSGGLPENNNGRPVSVFGEGHVLPVACRRGPAKGKKRREGDYL